MRLVIVNLSVRGISGGYEEYLRQFFSHAAREPAVTAILFVAVDAIAAKFADMPKVTLLRMPVLNALMGTALGIRRRIQSFRPDIVFVPVEKRFRHLADIPVVTMVQNIEPFKADIPGNSLVWRLFLVRMRHRAIAAIRQASHVIVLSAYSRDKLVQESDVPASKMTIIPHGMETKPLLTPVKPALMDDSTPFIFTAGTQSPARGTDDLVRAFIHLKHRGELAGIRLYIAGAVHRYNKSWHRALLRNISRAGLDDDVKWLGFLDKREMQWCFRNTRLFVVTSRVESFCITAVEAMANSTPVVSSDSPCLPETFGSYPAYYEAGNWKQLAALIPEALKGKKMRLGEVPGHMISWDDNFARTLALFKNMLLDNR